MYNIGIMLGVEKDLAMCLDEYSHNGPLRSYDSANQLVKFAIEEDMVLSIQTSPPDGSADSVIATTRPRQIWEEGNMERYTALVKQLRDHSTQRVLLKDRGHEGPVDQTQHAA